MNLEQAVMLGAPSKLSWSTVRTHSQGDYQLDVVLSVEGNDGDYLKLSNEIDAACLSFLTEASLDRLSDFFSQLPVARGLLVCLSDGRELAVCARGDVGIMHLATGEAKPLLQSNTVASQCIRGPLVDGDRFAVGTLVFLDFAARRIARSADPAQEIAALGHLLQDRVDAAMIAGVVLTCRSTVSAPAPHPLPITKDVSPKERVEPAPHFRLPQATSPVFSRSMLQPRPRLVRRIGLMFFALLSCAGILLAINQVIAYRRSARVEAIIAPLAQRLKENQDESRPRAERERQLHTLLEDLETAQETAKNDPMVRREIRDLAATVETIYQATAKILTVDTLPIFYDFRLIAPDFIASHVSYDKPGKQLVFLDQAQRRLVAIAVEKKTPQTSTIPDDTGELVDIAVTGRQAYVLGKSGIAQASLPLDIPAKLLLSRSEAWQDPSMIAAFGTNAYVLDKSARQLWRYETANPSSSPSSWLRGREGVVFSELTSLVIDGDVWAGTQTGKILRFQRGDRVPFEPSDVATPLSTPIVVTTTAEDGAIYILENRAKRLVVLNKKGDYQYSFYSEDLQTATGLVVDEQDRKIFLAAGSLVYELEIPQKTP